MDHRGLHVRVLDLAEIVRHRADGTDRRQAFFRVVAMLLEVLLDQRLQQRAAVGRQGLLMDQDLAQRLVLGQDPGVHPRDQGVAADKVHLHGQNAEQQIAIVISGADKSPGKLRNAALPVLDAVGSRVGRVERVPPPNVLNRRKMVGLAPLGPPYDYAGPAPRTG